MCELTQTALKGFLAQKFKDENDCDETTELDLDIPKSEKFSFAECPPFTHPFVQLDEDLTSITAATIEAKILAKSFKDKLLHILLQTSCFSPRWHASKVSILQFNTISFWLQSSMVHLNVTPEHKKKPEQKVRLPFFNNQVEDLVSVLGMSIDLETANDSQILLAIFKTKNIFSVTYDTVSNMMMMITMMMRNRG